jgi:hypothetical protein
MEEEHRGQRKGVGWPFLCSDDKVNSFGSAEWSCSTTAWMMDFVCLFVPSFIYACFADAVLWSLSTRPRHKGWSFRAFALFGSCFGLDGLYLDFVLFPQQLGA